MLKIITCKSPNLTVLERTEKLIQTYGFVKGDRQEEPNALVVTRNGLAYKHNEQISCWHPGLLHTLRESGTRHPWIQLGSIKKGDQILDCTLGLGTDARFLSEITETRVIGLEKSLEIFLMTEEGLRETKANVHALHVDSLSFLEQQADKQFDVIIADPMFPPHLMKTGQSLALLRSLSSYETLDSTWLFQAKRVARRCVLVKDHRQNKLLEQLQAEVIWSKGKRRTRYGYWSAT